MQFFVVDPESERHGHDAVGPARSGSRRRRAVRVRSSTGTARSRRTRARQPVAVLCGRLDLDVIERGEPANSASRVAETSATFGSTATLVCPCPTASATPTISPRQAPPGPRPRVNPSPAPHDRVRGERHRCRRRVRPTTQCPARRRPVRSPGRRARSVPGVRCVPPPDRAMSQVRCEPCFRRSLPSPHGSHALRNVSRPPSPHR